MSVNVRLPHPTAQHSIIAMKRNLRSRVLMTAWHAAFHFCLADDAAGVFASASAPGRQIAAGSQSKHVLILDILLIYPQRTIFIPANSV